jgi:hypothetical protein
VKNGYNSVRDNSCGPIRHRNALGIITATEQLQIDPKHKKPSMWNILLNFLQFSIPISPRKFCIFPHKAFKNIANCICDSMRAWIGFRDYPSCSTSSCISTVCLDRCIGEQDIIGLNRSLSLKGAEPIYCIQFGGAKLPPSGYSWRIPWCALPWVSLCDHHSIDRS